MKVRRGWGWRLVVMVGVAREGVRVLRELVEEVRRLREWLERRDRLEEGEIEVGDVRVVGRMGEVGVERLPLTWEEYEEVEAERWGPRRNYEKGR